MVIKDGFIDKPKIPPQKLPNILIFSLFRNKSVADDINRAYAIYFWRQCSGAKERLNILYSFIISPLLIINDIIKWYKINGYSVSKKSLIRQRLELLYLGYFYSIIPEEYYLYRFYCDSNFIRRSKSFVKIDVLKHSTYKLLNNYGAYLNKRKKGLSFWRKNKFQDFCMKNGIPTIPILLEFFPNGIIKDYRLDKHAILPEEDIFCKPNSGVGGQGTEAWYWKNGFYINPEGNRLEPSELKERIIGLTHKYGTYLIQPLVLPHASLLSFRKHCTPTLRLITYLGKDFNIALGEAHLKFTLNHFDVAPNRSKNIYVIPINLDTGLMGSAVQFTPIVPEKHLDSLNDGKQIVGRNLPFWQEAIDIVLSAHKLFLDHILIGWDIIITNEGPFIVEANSQPSLDYTQKANLDLLGEMTLGITISYHLNNAIKELYSGVIGSGKKKIDLYNGSKIKCWLSWLIIDNKKKIKLELKISEGVQLGAFQKWVKKQATRNDISGWAGYSSDGKMNMILFGKTENIEDFVRKLQTVPRKVEKISASMYFKQVKPGFCVLKKL